MSIRTLAESDEVKAAAKWWADCLRADFTIHDNGDAIGSAFATMAASNATRPTVEQCDAFERALCEATAKMLLKYDWDEVVSGRKDAMWGSTCRMLATDYGPDQTLYEALKVAGVERRGSVLLPCKTNMWINPGSVRVAAGYGRPAMTIFGEPRPEELGATV